MSAGPQRSPQTPGDKTKMRLPDGRTRLGKRDAAMLAILDGTGMRVGEISALRLTDVEIRHGAAFVTVEKSRARSIGRTRTIPLLWPDKYLAPIRRYVADLRRASPHAEWLFPGYRGDHVTVTQVERVVHKYRIGLPSQTRAEFIRSAERMLDLQELCNQLGIHPPRRTAKAWPFRASHKMQEAITDRAPTPQLREVVFERDGYRCCACGQHLTKGQAEIDHVDPTGPTVPSNLQVLCKPCNRWKKDYYVIDFRALWEWLDGRRAESPESSTRSPT
jgi:5-methylcytosine-specific restriction endonuclease McrA